jgi:hypothetical protein
VLLEVTEGLGLALLLAVAEALAELLENTTLGLTEELATLVEKAE